jgi:hypothetical protein
MSSARMKMMFGWREPAVGAARTATVAAAAIPEASDDACGQFHDGREP